MPKQKPDDRLNSEKGKFTIKFWMPNECLRYVTKLIRIR